MRRYSAVLVAIIGLAGLLAGCGSGKKNTTTSLAPPKPSEAQVEELLRLRGHMLKTNELSGFRPLPRRLFGTDAASWIATSEVPADARDRETDRLKRLGFRRAVEERLTPIKGGDTEGISIVEEFPSSDSARSELATQVRIAKTEGASEFPVSGVPGARGFGEPGAINVAFTGGRFYYLVGTFFPPGAPKARPGSPPRPSRSDVISAAKRLFTRLQQT